MRQSSKVDNSLLERRGILELIDKLKDDGITLQEMEQIGNQFRQAGRRALRPLVRELWRERSGELITKYAYILDFFEKESWLDQLIQIATKRRDLGHDGKAALRIALEGYGVDVSAPPFAGEFSGVGNPLNHTMQGAIRLGEEGIVSYLDEFLSYSVEAQKNVIRELAKLGDAQAARMLEALLWHEEPEIVREAITALGKIRDPRAAGTLARFLAAGSPEYAGEAEKSLRRLCFLGVSAPPLAPALPFHEGYVSPPDGDGYRSLLISRWEGAGELAVLYMQVHERRGLLAAWGAGGLSEEGFQSELAGFGAQDDLHRVDTEHVLELLKDALYWSRELCYLPADYYMRRGMFAGHDLTPAPFHPVFERAPQAPALSYREGEAISRELFEDPFFSGWFMAAERVGEFAEEHRRADDKAREQVLERFCAELITPELDVIRERLLKSADLMRRCGRSAGFVAKVVLLADTLLASPLPHHLHPFLRGFALESMEIAREAMGEEVAGSLPAAEER